MIRGNHGCLRLFASIFSMAIKQYSHYIEITFGGGQWSWKHEFKEKKKQYKMGNFLK